MLGSIGALGGRVSPAGCLLLPARRVPSRRGLPGRSHQVLREVLALGRHTHQDAGLARDLHQHRAAC
eukprot:1943836-Alexandrium_andersonii.AAC.1